MSVTGPRTAAGSDTASGSRPVHSWRYGRVRDGVLTTMASALSKTTRPLWYAESLVQAARFHQWLASAAWADGRVKCRDRLVLWEKLVQPRLAGASVTALEFGVADGWATRWWSTRGIPFEVWHGFDTFEGLPTAWDRGGVQVMAAGVFMPSAGAGSVPTISAPFPYRWHKGRIEHTLPLLQRPESKLFVLIDVDLLAPATVILDWLMTIGRPGDLVYLDEPTDPWNEGLALRQALDRGLSVRAIGYTGNALLIEIV